jgi:Cap4 dsDNA endonuclease/Cap4 SAVED domain
MRAAVGRGITECLMSDVFDDSDVPEGLASDAGGVAARQGFKFQDHVAAYFVLALIADGRLKRVECETADDIALSWQEDGPEFPEYVQVKTTEGDKKWSQGEIVKRASKARTPTSLAEKSLLCDKGAANALFRIVSRRAVNKTLKCLTLQRDSRQRISPAAELGAKLAKKYATKSPNGNDLSYWVRRTIWQVAGEVDQLRAINQQNLANLAEEHGANPTHSHVNIIYADLLKMVDDAAHASKVTHAADKIIARERAMDWWAKHLQETDAARERTAKPYRAIGDAFFADLHKLTEDDIRRALTSYDARYESGKWRSLQLADHLVDWLPEIALKASDLVSLQHLRMRQKTRSAVRTIRQQSGLTPQAILAETLLHAIIRQSMGSEPIACKLFWQSATGLRSFGSAHIVHGATKDELWLGRAKVATAATYEEIVAAAIQELEHVLDADFLKEERETIITLRQPQHLLPTKLEAALARNTPIDDLVDAVCIPVLLAYDSAVLGSGYDAGYKPKLIEEVMRSYEAIKPRLPTSVQNVKVHIFLIPVECVKTLTQQFSDLMQASA